MASDPFYSLQKQTRKTWLILISNLKPFMLSERFSKTTTTTLALKATSQRSRFVNFKKKYPDLLAFSLFFSFQNITFPFIILTHLRFLFILYRIWLIYDFYWRRSRRSIQDLVSTHSIWIFLAFVAHLTQLQRWSKTTITTTTKTNGFVAAANSVQCIPLFGLFE